MKLIVKIKQLITATTRYQTALTIDQHVMIKNSSVKMMNALIGIVFAIRKKIAKMDQMKMAHVKHHVEMDHVNKNAKNHQTVQFVHATMDMN